MPRENSENSVTVPSRYLQAMLPTQTDWSKVAQGLVAEIFCLQAAGIETEAEERLYMTLRGRLAFALGALHRQIDSEYSVWQQVQYIFFLNSSDTQATLADPENSEKPKYLA